MELRAILINKARPFAECEVRCFIRGTVIAGNHSFSKFKCKAAVNEKNDITFSQYIVRRLVNMISVQLSVAHWSLDTEHVVRRFCSSIAVFMDANLAGSKTGS